MPLLFMLHITIGDAIAQQDSFFGLHHFQAVARRADNRAVIICVIAREVGTLGHSISIAQELPVFLLLAVAVEVFHKQVFA